MAKEIKILVTVPGGFNPSWGTAVAAFLASKRYHVNAEPCINSGPNFNIALQLGMNAFKTNGFTHLVQLHTDTAVVCQREDVRYADVMVEELEKWGADFISVPNTIKDERALTSSGIGNPDNPWTPWRRWTVKELDEELPKTFDARKVGYGDKYLLHNNACSMWDLRKPIWWSTEEGILRHTFNFTERLRVVDGIVHRDVESEDWAYSRQMWKLGVKSILTTKLKLLHTGSMVYPNTGNWGTYKDGDEDTSSQWRPELANRVINRFREANPDLIEV